MAWNGSNGLFAADPGYATFTAWRNTPLEDAARDFLLARANLPLGARLWPFGASSHADADGWEATTGTVTPRAGFLALTPAGGRVVILSPREIDYASTRFDRLVLGVRPDAIPHSIRLFGRRTPTAAWQEIALPEPDRWQVDGAGVSLALPGAFPDVVFDQLRIELEYAPTAAAVALDHVALLPPMLSPAR